MYQDLDRIRCLENRMRRRHKNVEIEEKPSTKENSSPPLCVAESSGASDQMSSKIRILPPKNIEGVGNNPSADAIDSDNEQSNKKNRKLTDFYKQKKEKANANGNKSQKQKNEMKKATIVKLNNTSCDSHADMAEQNKILREKLKQREEQYARDKKKMKQMVINHVIESHRQERNQIRAKISANKIRLGEYVLIKENGKNIQVWMDGQELKNVKQKIEEIQKAKVDFEQQLQDLRSRPKVEVQNQLLFDPVGLLMCQLTYYHKQEAILLDILKKLEDQKNVHVKDFKRLFEQDSSKYGKPNSLRKLPAWPKIGNYQLLNLLGKGGFSQVYKGFDVQELREVACKIHEFDVTWNDDAKDSYIRHAIRENNVHKQLHHPNIVNLYNTIQIDRTSFVTIMEYCNGPDLSYYLKKHKQIPEQEAKLLIRQVLFGIKYLHELLPEKIIHYDLKPQNLIFHNGQLKITDFGLCKTMKLGHKYMELTSQGVGTYWYLPPECFHENTNISIKVDIWSLGVIYFEMLFNEKPFGNNMSQLKVLRQNVITKIKDNPLKFPEKPYISDDSKNFLKRCLEYNETDRMDAAEALRHAIFKDNTK